MIDYRTYSGETPLRGFSICAPGRSKLVCPAGEVDLPGGTQVVEETTLSMRPDPERLVYVRVFLVQGADGVVRYHADRFALGDPVPEIDGRVIAKLVRMQIPPGTRCDPATWQGESVTVREPLKTGEAI